MKKSIIFFAVFILGIVSVLILSGCASGTALVTGTQREAISADSVTIYTVFPEHYELIGIVTASSDAGWTEQDSLNYAIAELKNQAAKIGANGIILESVGTINAGGVIISGVYVPVSAQKVSGKAIYVAPNTQQELQ